MTKLQQLAKVNAQIAELKRRRNRVIGLRNTPGTFESVAGDTLIKSLNQRIRAEQARLKSLSN